MLLPYSEGKVTLTSRYGRRTLNGQKGYHNGIDLTGTSLVVCAPCDAYVGNSTIITDRSNRTWEWGNYVRLDTKSGLNIFLCHLSQRYVKTGDTVKAGDPIGIQGNTGYSFGSHVHFEIRKNGTPINPTAFLGIKNDFGIYDAKSFNRKQSERKPYKKNGLDFVPVEEKDFRIIYHGKGKKDCSLKNYINGGFFAEFATDDGKSRFVLPVGNLVCDVSSEMGYEEKKYLGKYIKGNKLILEAYKNQSPQFRHKNVSTLFVKKSGGVFVEDTNTIPNPDDISFAISGVPTVRNGDDVDYYAYVKGQGWDESCMRAGTRNWIGVKNSKLWVISGTTRRNNYIYGMEFWNKVKDEGYDDILCLDGGGSYYRKVDGKSSPSWGNRTISNIISW